MAKESRLIDRFHGFSWWVDEPKLPELQKKLIIYTAGPGGTISKDQNRYLPITPKEIVKNHADAVKAGASICHIHVRDENGFPSHDLEINKRVILDLKDKCPEAIIDQSFAYPMDVDTVEARLEPICKLGLPIELGTYSAASIVLESVEVYVTREAYLRDSVTYLQKHKIRPIITPYNTKQVEDLKIWAMESGLLKRPFISISLGLMGNLCRPTELQHVLRHLPQECDWIAETAGRNWLPTAVEAIIAGGHCRAGMEDAIYMYPHKDDLIKSSAEAVLKIRRIAEELGREVATPEEARQILKLGKYFEA